MSSFFSEEEARCIQNEAVKAEKLGRLTDKMLEIAYDRKLFHLLVPQKYGGHQMSLPALLPILEEASAFDGSFGWTTTLGAGAGIFAAYMNPAWAGQLFQDPRTFIAGSGYPGGEGEVKGNGLSVNGYWKYATGSVHATLFTANCRLTKNEEQVIRSIALYPAEVTIHPTWCSVGLKATASNDFEVRDCTIPEERCFIIAPEESHIDDPLYRYPFTPLAVSTLAASLIGMANNFIHRACNLITKEMKETDPVQKVLEEYQSARDVFYKAIEDSWQSCLANRDDSFSDISQVSETSRYVVAKALQTSHFLYPLTGMQVLHPDTGINRAWRDLHTASQHIFLRPSFII